MGKPIKPGAYERISQDTEGLALGVTRQREDLEALATQLGWDSPTHYVENDTSASKGKRRPVFESLKADFEAGEIDGILVYNFDRLTRRLDELVPFVKWVERTGCPVATCEGDDLLTANGRMVAHIKGAVAEQEARRISERTSRALLARARNGAKPSGRPPYGYDADMQIVPEEADRIRAWVKHILAGGSLGQLVRSLNAEGVPTPRGGRTWWPATVRSILRSPALTGQLDHTYRDPETGAKRTERFKGNWDPIITLAQHEALNAALSSNPGHGQHKPRKFLLSGLLTCGLCGASMYGATYNGGWMYRCRPQWGGCGRIGRSGPTVDALITLAVLTLFEEHQAKHGPIGSGGQPSQHDADAAIAETEARIERLRAGYATGHVDDADFFPTLRELRATLNTTKRKARTAEQDKARREAQARFTAADWNAASLEEKRSIVRAMLAQIVIKRSSPGRFDPHSIAFKGHGAKHFVTFDVVGPLPFRPGHETRVTFAKAA
ncbi:recombinase family protein [Actinomadura sp. 6N118]|uniref:recombinase family protein n=1 Tax=Actinomadura sp. 6N118 TaxID=3375151 RepID=UPI0037A6E0EC